MRVGAVIMEAITSKTSNAAVLLLHLIFLHNTLESIQLTIKPRWASLIVAYNAEEVEVEVVMVATDTVAEDTDTKAVSNNNLTISPSKLVALRNSRHVDKAADVEDITDMVDMVDTDTKVLLNPPTIKP
jgi:hypothetical protein